jgi:CBS domain-containing protein
MRVREVMSSPALVTTPGTSVKAAAAMLAGHRFTCLPVVDDGTLVGMVSEEDLLVDRFPPDRRVPRTGSWRCGGADTVGEVMRGLPVVARPGQAIEEVLRALRAQGRRAAPVLERGLVVGVVTYGDLLGALARDDTLIEADVRRRVAVYAGAGRWSAAVQDGRVMLTGDETDPVELSTVQRIAESVLGVTGVGFAGSAVRP